MIKTCERGRQEQPVCGDRGSFMTGTMFFNMLLNIGLLVLLATLLTNMASVLEAVPGREQHDHPEDGAGSDLRCHQHRVDLHRDKTGGAIVNTRCHRRSDSRDHGRTACRNDDGHSSPEPTGFCLILAALQQLPARSRRWWKACWEVWSIKSTRQERWTASICFS